MTPIAKVQRIIVHGSGLALAVIFSAGCSHTEQYVAPSPSGDPSSMARIIFVRDTGMAGRSNPMTVYDRGSNIEFDCMTSDVPYNRAYWWHKADFGASKTVVAELSRVKSVGTQVFYVDPGVDLLPAYALGRVTQSSSPLPQSDYYILRLGKSSIARYDAIPKKTKADQEKRLLAEKSSVGLRVEAGKRVLSGEISVIGFEAGKEPEFLLVPAVDEVDVTVSTPPREAVKVSTKDIAMWVKINWDSQKVADLAADKKADWLRSPGKVKLWVVPGGNVTEFEAAGGEVWQVTCRERGLGPSRSFEVQKLTGSPGQK